ncbi:ATP-binding protein [Streptomyces buecherae]|uniref:histidine kinase n=1 Tax=Streptomyces buecherae TaxID=2763006 RepID=A0A7H8NEF6_9ACTN|nr:ATP-binding protein [Streptomyces buecherae]QKW52834.1 ATP-binding protein [Streptomyces buecherae]
MTQHISEVVFWCVAAALLIVAVLLLRQRQITTGLRKHNAALEASLRARDEEARHLVEVRLPAAEDSGHQSLPAPGLLDEQLTGTAYAWHLQQATEQFAGAVEKAQTRADQAAKAALKASMRALQGLAHEQQLSISRMQDRHDNPDVLRDLLEIDHANSQFGRRAQAIAVLCGSWPGRQRAASPLLDVVRGATSRIRDYRRVRVHAQVDIAVASRAVEPVVLAVAELLDNAARHSQPNTAVEVNLQPAHNGACVVIDDAGVGMDGQEIERATRLLSGRQSVDVSRLGDPPQFGFAAIGILAARYGFNVSVDTRSPYGGVRAVLFLPSVLLTHVTEDGPSTVAAATPPAVPSITTAAGAAPTHTRTPTQAGPQAAAARPAAPRTPTDHEDGEPVIHGSTAGGLPKRRRRQPAPGRATTAATPAAPLPPAEQAPARTAEETARRMGAFARGTRSGRATNPNDEEGNSPA